MGVAAAVGAAAVWAISAVLLASQRRTLDFVSVSALRLVAASLFFLAVLWPLGASGDLTRMSLDDIGQLIGTAVLNIAVGDTFYIGAVMLLGVNFAYPAGLGLFALFSFLLSVIFLGETVTPDTALGSALVLAGVYVVLLYGRQSANAPAPTSGARRAADNAVAHDAPARPTATASAARHAASLTSRPPRPDPGAGRRRARAAGDHRAQLGRRHRLDARRGGGLRRRGGRPGAHPLGDDHGRRDRVPDAGILAATAGGAAAQPRACLAIEGVIGAGVGSLLLIIAVQDIGAGETAVLVSLSPLFALPLAAVFLGERVTPWLVVGIVLAVGGVILLSV